MTGESFRFVVGDADGRLDRLLADATGLGRRTVQRWLAEGRVRVDGRVARAGETPPRGSEVTVAASPTSSREITPDEALPVRLLLETQERVILAKPAGMHCERGLSSPSVADWLEARYGDLSAVGARPEEAGLVHRLDRDTSGVLLAARDAGEYRRLRALFSRGQVHKQYLALVAGRVEDVLEVDSPLARRGPRMIVAGPRDEALEASTRFEALENGDGWSLVLVAMRSGVMHQVRVHAAAAGHPLVGDALYGGPVPDWCPRRGQLLHALRIRLAGEFDVSAAPPDDFVRACARLRRGGLPRALAGLTSSS